MADTIPCGNGTFITQDEMHFRLEDVAKFVRMSYERDCSHDYECLPVLAKDAGPIVDAIEWPRFNPLAVKLLLSLMKDGTLVTFGRCSGPTLAFVKPGSWKGGVRGMFKKAVADVEEYVSLGFSRILCEQYGYMLTWNEE